MATNATPEQEGSDTTDGIDDAIEQLRSTRKKIHNEGDVADFRSRHGDAEPTYHWFDDRVDELDTVIELLENDGDDDSLPEITHHVEAPEFGGCEYARCEGCGVESVGGPNHILHDDDCPHSEVRR